jgi:hypothetical protein
MAGRNGLDKSMPGSSASSGGSMRNPGGTRTDTYTHDPRTGAANTHPNTGPQTGPAYGSSGSRVPPTGSSR